MRLGEDFYATLKLTSGEEIFAKVAPLYEETKSKNLDYKQLMLDKPVVVIKIPTKKNNNVTGYKMESWLKTCDDNCIIINKCDIITITESNNLSIIQMYDKYNSLYNDKEKMIKLGRKQGYITTTNSARELLEIIYKNPSAETNK